jgi:hypothetical protein
MFTTLPTTSAVHALHEVLEVEVDVVDAGAELGGEVVAQVLGVEVVEVVAALMKVPRLLDILVPLTVRKPCTYTPVGRAQAGRVQHRGPEQAVEIDDVLADEVVELGVAARAARRRRSPRSSRAQKFSKLPM